MNKLTGILLITIAILSIVIGALLFSQKKDSGNLEIISAINQEQKQQEVLFQQKGDVSVSIEIKGEKRLLILKEDDKEIILEEGFTSEGAENSLQKGWQNIGIENVRFSPKKNYVIYDFIGYEWGGTRAYDIHNKKHLENFDLASDMAFSQDERYVYRCGYRGPGKIATITDLHNAKIVYDAFGSIIAPETYEKNNEYNDINCWVRNGEREIIEMRLQEITPFGGTVSDITKEKTIIFDVTTGVATEH